MTDLAGHGGDRRPGRAVSALLGFALLTLFLGAAASGQDGAGAPAGDAATQQAPPPAEPATPRRPSGLLEALGRWFDDSVSNLGSGLKGTQQKLGDMGNQAGGAATGAAKGAVDAVARLPAVRVVDGRERCVTAANGAPDCVAAATAICRRKGFNAGKSVDVESAQKCPARVLLLGRRATESECQVETYVTRAMCQ
jgi:hypothetical protein